MFKKHSEDFNFKVSKTYDIEKIKEIASNFDSEWYINTERQNRNTTHQHTLTYYIYETDLFWIPEYEYIVKQKSDNVELLNAVEPIVKDLEEKYNGLRGQVLLIKLVANKEIPPHTDKGSYLMKARRHHIPIITSSGTVFGVGDEEVSMGPGECWEINNSRTHYVNNYSDVDRIHLLIDIMPKGEL